PPKRPAELLPAGPPNQRSFHDGNGTMAGAWVASLAGKTCSLPSGVHCQTPIEARRFCPASLGSSGQSKLVNLIPLPFTRETSGRSSLSAIFRSSSGSNVLAFGNTSVKRAQIAEKPAAACPAGGRFIFVS